MRHPSSQAGNILFIILIAVALFAALTYAVFLTTRNGSAGADRDQAKMISAAFSQYGQDLSATIMRMMITGGCRETTLSFETPAWQHPGMWGGSTNSLAPADRHCDVFGPQGTVFIQNF